MHTVCICNIPVGQHIYITDRHYNIIKGYKTLGSGRDLLGKCVKILGVGNFSITCNRYIDISKLHVLANT